MQKHDPKRERCWIAELRGEVVGSVFVVKKSETIAQLRLLYVEPSARGLALGVNRSGLPNGVHPGRNDAGEIGWRGPNPPRGPHRYTFRLLALDSTLDPDVLGGLRGRVSLYSGATGALIRTHVGSAVGAQGGWAVAAGLLQRKGLIQYQRGRIRIADRAGLEAASCACYEKVRQDTDRLLAIA